MVMNPFIGVTSALAEITIFHRFNRFHDLVEFEYVCLCSFLLDNECHTKTIIAFTSNGLNSSSI